MKSTKKLIKRLSEGDEKAFDTIFIAYYPRLRFFISGIIADEAEAENIAQDIFYKLWQSREKIAKVENLSAYIFQMGRNAALNYVERSLLFNNYAEKYGAGKNLRQHVDEADEILIAAQMQELINNTVEHMPAQRRDIFQMSRVQGKSNDEIAHELSLSKRTVETHISAALSDIRKAMSADKIN